MVIDMVTRMVVVEIFDTKMVRKTSMDVMMMACRHIPTMTKSHHGGEMSVMIKVGICQCQIPTIHDKLQLGKLFNSSPVLGHKTQN